MIRGEPLSKGPVFPHKSNLHEKLEPAQKPYDREDAQYSNENNKAFMTGPQNVDCNRS
jgi:hypothetical protein